MTEYQGRFARYNNKLPYVATVKIKIEESDFSVIKVNCNGEGSTAQGYIEYVPKSVTKVGKKARLSVQNML